MKFIVRPSDPETTYNTITIETPYDDMDFDDVVETLHELISAMGFHPDIVEEFFEGGCKCHSLTNPGVK